jgi:hypothetical protein
MSYSHNGGHGNQRVYFLSRLDLEMSERPHPVDIARAARDRGHVPNFLAALCELLMCSDPYPASEESRKEIVKTADIMSRQLGFTDWVEAYHGLCHTKSAEGSAKPYRSLMSETFFTDSTAALGELSVRKGSTES